MLVLYLIIGYFLWYTLGCGVLIAIDKDGRLEDWIWNKAPNHFYSVVAILLFPIVATIYLYENK